MRRQQRPCVPKVKFMLAGGLTLENPTGFGTQVRSCETDSSQLHFLELRSSADGGRNFVGLASPYCRGKAPRPREL